MSRMLLVTASLVVFLGAEVAMANEVGSPANAAMIISIVTAPVDARRSTYDAALKDPAPASSDAASGPGEILADGSVRYGRTVITVRNPCPPGEHFVDLPLTRPGRR